jgi:basic amino acid/polyamine antiporter, APA family
MAHTATIPQERSATQITSLLRGLSLTDSILLMVGGIIGSGIFLTAGSIAGAVRTPRLFLGVWLVGGAVSLMACFAFAELGAMYPEAGGLYVYLREAFGDFPAFLYGWMVFTVIQSGGIAAVSVGFADYLGACLPVVSAHAIIAKVGPWTLTRGGLVAVSAIVLVTAVNVVGLRRGSTVINLATIAKFAAIGGFVVLGFGIGHGSWLHFSTGSVAAQPMTPGQLFSGFGVAMIAVFWAFDGWVFITWASGEVKNPQRTLPRTMILGILIVIVVYLLINGVYLFALPVAQIAKEETIAQASADALFSPGAGQWLSGLIALSCFGALASCILPGARVPYAMARDGVFFQAMGRVNRFRAPAVSLVGLSALAVVFTLSGSFDQLLTYSIFMSVVAYVVAVAGLFVLRRKYPDAPRPYRCTGYPYLPALYLVITVTWALNSVVSRPKETLIGIGIALLGVPLYFFWKRRGEKATDPVQFQ